MVVAAVVTGAAVAPNCGTAVSFARGEPAAESPFLPTRELSDATHPDRHGVLVLTMLYRPEPNLITADVAERLALHGPVTVVTTHPNYPFGRFYPEVRRPWLPRRTVEGGVKVWRVPHFADHSTSPLKRLVSYLSFAFMAGVLAPFLCPRPRTVWVYQTPFTTALAALWFRLRGARVVYTAPDLWPEGLSAAGAVRSPFLMRLMFAYSRWINRRAHHIVCTTRGILERYAKDGVPRQRLSYVPVWVEGLPSGELPPPPPPGVGIPSVVYAGNLGPAQGLNTLIRAAAQLQRKGVRVRFDVYGSGTSEDELRALAAELGASNVHFHGRVSPDEAFQACSGALATVVSLRATPLLGTILPSKLAFGFAAGAPVLYGLPGEAAAVAAASGGALPFDVDAPATLADAVERLLALPDAERRAMAARLRAYFEEHFSPRAQLAAYEQLLGGSTGKPAPTEGTAEPERRTRAMAAAGER
jgi:colanic acid biosynthesis glycosyl transferase WcaI